VLDLMLPGGRAASDILDIEGEAAEVSAVIVVTALSPSKEVQGSDGPNVVLFLSKPINQNKLLGPCTRSQYALALSAGNLRERVKLESD